MKYRTLFIISLLLLVCLLVPLLFVGNYAVPQGDDFGFSGDVRHAVVSGGSVFDMISAAIYRAKETYFSWQGSFSAIFLMALQPGVFGFRYYTIATYFLVFSLIAGITFLTCRIYAGIFKINRYAALTVSVIELVACTQLLPLAYQSFYWYNGSVYYTFFFALSLFVYGASIGYVLKGGIWRIVVSTILCAFIGGGNYITALTTVIVLALFALYLLIIRKDRRWTAFIFPFIAVTASLIISMIAPGNSEREASSASTLWIAETLLVALQYALSCIKDWLSLPLAGLLVLLVPIFYKEAGSCERPFRWPVAVSILSFALMVAMFVPHVYALRTPGSSRLFNIYYFAFVVLISFNLFYWIGWFRHRCFKERIGSISFAGVAASAAVCLALFVVSVLKFDTHLTSVMALGEIRSGEAKGFYSEMLERESVLEDDSIKNVVLKPLSYNPYLLFSEDMKEDPSNFMNEDAATYFDKESIIVR